MTLLLLVALMGMLHVSHAMPNTDVCAQVHDVHDLFPMYRQRSTFYGEMAQEVHAIFESNTKRALLAFTVRANRTPALTLEEQERISAAFDRFMEQMVHLGMRTKERASDTEVLAMRARTTNVYMTKTYAQDLCRDILDTDDAALEVADVVRNELELLQMALEDHAIPYIPVMPDD